MIKQTHCFGHLEGYWVAMVGSANALHGQETKEDKGRGQDPVLFFKGTPLTT
jgi:hypothetical protein